MVLAFTLIELLVVVAIVAVCAIPIVVIWYRGTTVKIVGTWTTVPPAVHQAPATATFVFTMTKQIANGQPVALTSREVIVAVAPTTDVRIVNIADDSGTTPYVPSDNKITATTKTDSNGTVSVTISVDHLGQGTVTAIDTKSSASEVADWTGVP